MLSNILYLFPESIEQLDPTRLIDELKSSGFIGETFEYQHNVHYKPGTEFLQLVTFLGCSPVVSLGEIGSTGEEFAHIQFVGPFEQPQFVGGENIKPIRCQNCGHRDTESNRQLPNWLRLGQRATWQCPQCGHQTPIAELKWRKCGGLGQFFIKIWGIFESEAVPGDRIQHILRESSGCEWRYFYFRGDDQKIQFRES